MKNTCNLPDGWTTAVDYFARLGKEELIKHKLPTASKDRKSLLRYLYTNGTRFVYSRGGWDTSIRLNNAYTTWQDARKLGGRKYLQEVARSNPNSKASGATHAVRNAFRGTINRYERHNASKTMPAPAECKPVIMPRQVNTWASMQPAQAPPSQAASPASWFPNSHAAAMPGPQTSLATSHAGAYPCKPFKGPSCVPGLTVSLPSAQQHQSPGQCHQLPRLGNTGPAALHMTSVQPTGPGWQTPAVHSSPAVVCDIETGVETSSGEVCFASLLAELQEVSQQYNSSGLHDPLASGWPEAYSSSSNSRKPTQPCTSKGGICKFAGLSSSHSPSASSTTDARISANSECKAAHGQARQPAAVSDTQALATSVSDVRQMPTWDWPIQLCDSDTLMPNGQQVYVSAGKDIGSGGFGGVKEVVVKLFGRDSLAAISSKNQALINLLKRKSCTCGAILQGADCDASQSSLEECRCSVRMALKIPTVYANLPAAVREHFDTPEKYRGYCEKQVYTEYSVMEKCQRSPHILDCFAVGSLERAGVQQHCLLLELSELGTVEKHYSKMHGGCHGLDAVQTQRLVRQVTSGLSNLHQLANTIHRDIKSSNLLLFGSLETPEVKICDFGVSKVLAGAGNYGHTTIGTLEWAAPEQGDSGVGQDYRLDTYPLGLLVLALRTGRLPLWWVIGESLAKRADLLLTALDNPQSPYNTLDNYKHGPLGPVEKDFVKRCLQAQLHRRPSAIDLLLTDPYLQRSYAGN